MQYILLVIDSNPELYIKEVSYNSQNEITGYSTTTNVSEAWDGNAQEAIDLSNALSDFIGTRPIKRP